MILDINSIKNFEFKVKDIIEPTLTSIIILTHNQLEYTKLCIESIRKFTPINSYEIIIVDNDSKDGTVEWLKQQSDLSVIYNNVNQGFPKGCNQGFEISKGDNILFLNNDVIVTPNWLENLDKALKSNENIGAVGAITNRCTYYQSIQIDYSNIEEMLLFAKQNNLYSEKSLEYRTKLIGFCFMAKRNVLLETGVFDERFSPGNYEDDDLSFRIVSKGYKLCLCKSCFIHHFGSISFKEMDIYGSVLQLNSEKFEEKWGFNSGLENIIRYDFIEKIDINRSNNIKVLEYNCGTGATLLSLSSIYNFINTNGICLNKNTYTIAKNTLDNVFAFDENYEELLSNEKYDYILINDFNHTYEEIVCKLEFFKKCIKNNGKILLRLDNNFNISLLRNMLMFEFNKLWYPEFKKVDSVFKYIKSQNCFDYTVYIKYQCELQEYDNYIINNILKLENNMIDKDIYTTAQYLIEIKYTDIERYSKKDMRKLKYLLMRIDNGHRLNDIIEVIKSMYEKYGISLVDDIEHILENNIINKNLTLNNLIENIHKDYELDSLTKKLNKIILIYNNDMREVDEKNK